MRRHPTDSVSLVFALLFIAAVAWWGVAMISSDPLHVPAAWIGAGTLLVIGLVGLVSALRPQRRPVEAPLTVPQAPQAALDPDPYADPFLASMSLPRVDGVLDADAIAAAYREAGFEAPVAPAAPAATAVADRPTDTARAAESAPLTDAAPADADEPTTKDADDADDAEQTSPRLADRRGDTKELPADRDGSASS
ncbi:hypothetical protein [Cryptosporangium minutisporangium]|uniref:hypothetical protein n=1 Tax=Cryptosporangium minutisporangium TaxID=113569 RepID=UPI0035EF4119